MSAGVIYQETLRTLRRQSLPAAAERDVVMALEAAQPGPLVLLYEAGTEAGLRRELLLPRAVGIFLGFAAGNLADDLCDGECSYYEEPARVGPYVQFLLQNLAWAILAQAELSERVMAEAARGLVMAAGPQALEVRTRQWTAPLFQQVAEGLAGQQWAAYLHLLWAGTRLESQATVGYGLGIAAHVAEDIRSRDLRFFSMSEVDQREVMRWAQAAVERVRAQGLRCLDSALRRIEPILQEVVP
ncbi:hypothetical protein POL68_26525 [Stigmatella sp. ncwal1]|uniref:Uncharacterized protein n=1 Tax=Stigmatella ashevillensis TaxID=2995309 RepID=A0ABT5DI93_9BACT|nr:hypothetical protein [Stigmatella ashevillena]MDC0712052.1 hypothetical protein [Stigmatella ashevillena]